MLLKTKPLPIFSAVSETIMVYHGISRHWTFDLEVNTFGYIAKAIGPHDVLDSAKKGWFVADD